MSALIYVETSIASFYHETRMEAQFQARREWTRAWWEVARRRDELVTSLAVIAELEAAPEPKRTKGVALLEPLPLLQSSPEVDELVAVYVKHKLMPTDATGDARHLRSPLSTAVPASRRGTAGTLPIPTNASTLSA